jgi:hypothetical protein
VPTMDTVRRLKINIPEIVELVKDHGG